MGPNLTRDIFDALGLNQAGTIFEAGESFILADVYIPFHQEGDRVIEEVMPTFLHAGSGRRFRLTIQEIASDTPGDPALEPQIPQVDAPIPESPGFTNTAEERAAVTAESFSSPQPTEPSISPNPENTATELPGDDVTGDPPVPSEIQSLIHEAQPENPESNVPADFEQRVAEIDAAIAAGETPTPDGN